jgi:hypothetical protein
MDENTTIYQRAIPPVIHGYYRSPQRVIYETGSGDR